MAITQVRYPFDKTGKASTNLVTGETRSVDHEYRRAWAPTYGMYFGDSLAMWDTDTGAKLFPGTDYLLLYPDPDMTAKLGAPVYSLISLTNKAVVNVKYNYQVVGGDASFSIYAIQQLLNNLQQDNRVVTWDNIWGKPLTFQPTPHLHDVTTDIVGFEYLVLALEELSRVVSQGDVASHDVIYDYINRVLAQLNALAKKEQADVDNLQAQINALTVRINDLQNQVTANLNRLNAHMADKGNPHQVTKAQVGLGLVQNYPVASVGQAQAGVDNTTYMTPALVAAFVSATVWPTLNAHLSNYSNPHQVTKAQVGLGSVQNYPVASVGQAQAGTDSASYMTPALVAAFVSATVWPTLNSHLGNFNNPHQVTKAQVGLGSVQNYPVASVGQAQAGTDSASYMTPALVSAFVSATVWPTLNSHLGNFSNPHRVTAGQVGLGLVQNYGVASVADAQAGWRQDAYLTPYLARQEISALVPPMVQPQLDSMQNQINNIPTTRIQANVSGFTDYQQTTDQRIYYRIAGAAQARIMTSDLVMHFSSYERNYFNLYVGGDGLGWSQLMRLDTGNNGARIGHYKLKGIYLPAVGVGNWNYIMVKVDTKRSTTITCDGGDVTIAPALGDFVGLTRGTAAGVANYYTTDRAQPTDNTGTNR